MPLFTKKPPRGIEIPHLITAAHEIGHVIVFQEAGVEVYGCKISLDGAVDGGTWADDPVSGQHHAFLVGIMAGKAGEALWCDIFGQRLPSHCRDGSSYAGDRVLFTAHQRKHREARGLSWRKADRLARVILRAESKRFRKLTEQLARHGEIDFGK